MELRPEQSQALDYARRKGSESPVASIRARVEATFRELETQLDSIPGNRTARTPAPGKWSTHEIVDHLVVSHRRAAGELEELVAGRSPAGGPIPAGLASQEPYSTPWPTLVAELEAVHLRFLGALQDANDDTPQTARAPVVMVVKCHAPDGRLEPVEWIESFDWKAYAILVRAHTLEHGQQIQRTLDALA